MKKEPGLLMLTEILNKPCKLSQMTINNLFLKCLLGVIGVIFHDFRVHCPSIEVSLESVRYIRGLPEEPIAQGNTSWFAKYYSNKPKEHLTC